MEVQNDQSKLVKELEERNAFIETILQNLPIGIAVNKIDDGKATVVNKRFSEIYGWPDADLTDVHGFFKNVYPDEAYRKEIMGKVMNDIQSGDEDRMRWTGVTVTTQTGEKRAINSKNIPLYDQNLMISTVMDVTTEYTQATEIKRAKANQEALINGTQDFIWSVDTELCIITANHSFLEMLKGATGKDIKEGDNVLFKEFGKEQLAKWKLNYERALKGEQFTIKDQIFNPAQETTVYSVISLSPMFNEKNILFGVACYARDITQETLNLLEKKKSDAALIESEKIYKYLFDKNPSPIFIWDLETLRIIDCNEEAIIKYGYTRKELFNLTMTELRPSEDMLLHLEAKKTEDPLGGLHKKTWRHKKKNGELICVDITAQLIHLNGKRVGMGIVNDVTESRYYHELDQLEKNILEMTARNEKSITEVISIYLSGVESLHPGMLCSIQEKKGNCLFNLSSPSLPPEYLKSIEGGEIGSNAGSCGTAAFLKQKVIVTDIANDIRWKDYKEIAGKYQLKTCWSYPILNGDNNVIATLACYYREIKAPAELEEKTIQRAEHILQIILERYQRERALKISNERFELATLATSDIIWDWNLETNAVFYSGNIQKLFGHASGVNNDNLPFYFDHVHPDDRERVVLYPDQVKYGTMLNWTQEYRFRKANGEYAFVVDKGIVVRNEQGVGVRMIGAIQDITVMKQNELRILQQNQQLNEIALINAHEIRRPVATILGLIQLFNKETIGGESNKDLLKHLETVTQDLDTVIKRIIDKTVN